MIEIWKPIPSWEELYEVSNFGNYRNKIYRKGGGKKYSLLKPKVMKDGYLMFRVSKKGKQKLLNAHRVVACVFVKNLDKKEQVNHKDFNKTNNSYSNLEWVTPKENIQHALKGGRFHMC